MKTKLLKKIRKRFFITRIDNLASNDNYLRGILKDYNFELPVYNYVDTYDFFGISSIVFQNIDDAKDHLMKKILSKYSEKFRHKDRKETKVWWIK